MSLSRDAILKHVDTRIVRVDVPEMGGEVCVASLTVAEADRIRTLGEGNVPAVVGVVILGACDDDGKRLFTDKDAEALGKLPASALGRISSAVLDHNGLSAKAPEEAKNGSSETVSDDSASASPSPSEELLPSSKAA